MDITLHLTGIQMGICFLFAFAAWTTIGKIYIQGLPSNFLIAGTLWASTTALYSNLFSHTQQNAWVIMVVLYFLGALAAFFLLAIEAVTTQMKDRSSNPIDRCMRILPSEDHQYWRHIRVLVSEVHRLYMVNCQRLEMAKETMEELRPKNQDQLCDAVRLARLQALEWRSEQLQDWLDRTKEIEPQLRLERSRERPSESFSALVRELAVGVPDPPEHPLEERLSIEAANTASKTTASTDKVPT